MHALYLNENCVKKINKMFVTDSYHLKFSIISVQHIVSCFFNICLFTQNNTIPNMERNIGQIYITVHVRSLLQQFLSGKRRHTGFNYSIFF